MTGGRQARVLIEVAESGVMALRLIGDMPDLDESLVTAVERHR